MVSVFKDTALYKRTAIYALIPVVAFSLLLPLDIFFKDNIYYLADLVLPFAIETVVSIVDSIFTIYAYSCLAGVFILMLYNLYSLKGKLDSWYSKVFIISLHLFLSVIFFLAIFLITMEFTERLAGMIYSNIPFFS